MTIAKRILSRRDSHAPSNRVRFGQFRFDLAKLTLVRNDRRVRLAEQPAALLRLLLLRQGRLVTRQEIREHLWQDRYIEVEPAINTAARRVRTALDDRAETPVYVETVRGQGYRFIAPVQFEGREPTRRTWKPRLVALAAVAVLAVGASLVTAWIVANDSVEDLNVEVQDLLTEADYLLGRGDIDAIEAARDRYRRVTETAPRFGRAWVGLAEASVCSALASRDPAGLTEARSSAERALALRPDDPDALAQLGLVELYQRRDWSTTRRHLQRAAELGSGSSSVYVAWSFYLAAVGESEPARAAIERALAMDPVSPRVRGDAAWLYYLLGDFEEADREGRHAAELGAVDAGQFTRLMAGQAAGDWETAGAAADRLVGRSPASGATPDERVRRFWTELVEPASEDRPPMQTAMALASLGREEEAVACLRRAVAEQGSCSAPYLAVLPVFAGLRDRPEFEDLLASVGVPTDRSGSRITG